MEAAVIFSAPAVSFWPARRLIELYRRRRAVNLVSERISISRIIEKNRLLRCLDGLGREEEKLT